MIFKKGDRVKFLNDVGGGIVSQVSGKTVYVENEDGFEIPATASQLLHAEVSQSEMSPFTATTAAASPERTAEPAEPQREPAPLFVDLADSTEETNIDISVNILLAWIPQHKKNGKIAAWDLYLINDCGYHTVYVSAMISSGACHGIQAGILESKTTIHLTQIAEEHLTSINSIRLEVLFYKKGTYMPQEPMHYELKIDSFYITDAVNYAENIYFDEKALIHNISEEYLMAEIENTARSAKFEKQKKQIDRPPSPKPLKKAVDNSIEEIDLHIEQLIDNPKTVTPAEMLDIQMQHFTAALDSAIKKHTRRIVFIHGVGNGRLRLEIRRTLDREHPRLRYQDASFREYGYGATMVILHA